MSTLHSPSFAPLSFVERLSRAAREPVYSAAFAWLLDDDSPLSLKSRVAIIEEVTGETFGDVRSIAAETEWEKVDLLLTLRRPDGSAYVAVENKIKATDHERQLAEYDDKLLRLPSRAIKLFLTLGGELPRSGEGWRPLSYRALANAIAAQQGADHPMIADLNTAILRLSHVSLASINDTALVQLAYGDSDNEQPHTELAGYVTRLKLTKVVQRIWMAELAAKLPIKQPWQIWIDESNGQALLDVRAFMGGGQPVLIGVQIQGRTIKLSSAPYPYPKVATAEQHLSVEAALRAIIERAGLPENTRMSRPGNRGFRSVTVDNMPPGREVDQWAAKAARLVNLMQRAFPDVQPIPRAGIVTATGDQMSKEQ